MGKRVHLVSFGCQMNDYDVSRMLEVLSRDGYERTDTADDADLFVVNTCAIREKAEAKTVSAVGRIRPHKQRRPGVLVAVGGCVPTLEGQRLLDDLPDVDLIFGPDAVGRLPDLLRRVEREGDRLSAVDFTEVESYRFLDADPRPDPTRVTALVTIQKGCDNACAYCVVPTTRGAEVSRPTGEVLDEVARFVETGAREVTLIGQNVNSYRRDGVDFTALLERVARTPGLWRLRFTTSHPKDFLEPVADCFRDLPPLCEWLHLPVQSGSTRVLARMQRTYTRDEYLSKIDHLRRVCPDISLSTDVIVGYPGESDHDFEQTVSLLEEVQYDSIYSFKYSPRPATPAISLGDPVDEQVKSERLWQVQALQKTITARRLARFVGRIEEVLVEGESQKGGQACGRTRGNVVVNFAPPGGVRPADLVGRLVHVPIAAARTHTLLGAGAGAADVPERGRISLPVV
jgi:tRNA-2-methylthio-N6-dimethylallyladenosine synthase